MSESNYSTAKKKKKKIVVICGFNSCGYIHHTIHIENCKKKKSYPKRAGKHNFRAKSINTHHMPNHSQAYFLSATLPPQVNDNYV